MSDAFLLQQEAHEAWGEGVRQQGLGLLEMNKLNGMERIKYGL